MTTKQTKKQEKYMGLTNEVLFLMEIFKDYVKRNDLMENQTPEMILAITLELSDAQVDWLESFQNLWEIVTNKQQQN